MLLESQRTTSTTTLTLSAVHSWPTIRQVGNTASAETLARAKSMMQSSTNGGVFRRLNQSERLRASSGQTFPEERKERKLNR